MITLEQAKTLTYGQILYNENRRNADGTKQRWRLSGKVRTWKRDKGRVYIPLKHGLYSNDSLTETDFPGGECLFMSLVE